MLDGNYILVVEDDSETGAFVAAFLSDSGYAVHAVPNTAAAHSALAVRQPTMLLCDYHLPGDSGLELAREMRSSGSTVPIILMTADTQAAQQLDLTDVTYCLIKPFDLDDLLRCVDSCIQLQA